MSLDEYNYMMIEAAEERFFLLSQRIENSSMDDSNKTSLSELLLDIKRLNLLPLIDNYSSDEIINMDDKAIKNLKRLIDHAIIYFSVMNSKK